MSWPEPPDSMDYWIREGPRGGWSVALHWDEASREDEFLS